jgi:GDPmannose 4,6-dehydratase
VDPALLRPAEVYHLRGDASGAERKLGWKPAIEFEELVGMMVDADLAGLEKQAGRPAESVP